MGNATPRTAKSGETCPESGIWSPNTQPHRAEAFAAGNVMPTLNDRPVTWTLVPDDPTGGH